MKNSNIDVVKFFGDPSKNARRFTEKPFFSNPKELALNIAKVGNSFTLEKYISNSNLPNELVLKLELESKKVLAEASFLENHLISKQDRRYFLPWDIFNKIINNVSADLLKNRTQTSGGETNFYITNQDLVGITIATINAIVDVLEQTGISFYRDYDYTNVYKTLGRAMYLLDIKIANLQTEQ